MLAWSARTIIKMTFSNFWKTSVLAALTCALLPAQINAVLTVNPPEKIAGKRGQVVTADFGMVLKNGYHVNSNTPSDEYLIPLGFTWTKGPAEVVEVVFPKPKLEKYEFSPKPISVFSGEFKTQVKFKIP